MAIFLREVGESTVGWGERSEPHQRGSSRHVQNSKELNYGKGYFIGHQWINIVLCMGEKIIPLPPIAFLSRRYYGCVPPFV